MATGGNYSQKIKCLICANQTSQRKSVIPALDEFIPVEALSDMFHYFAKYMKWDTAGHQFDFCRDPFPFCPACKELLAELTVLGLQVDGLLGRIKEITTMATTKIILSTLNGAVLEESVGETDEEGDASYFDEGERRKHLKYSSEGDFRPRLAYAENVMHFRNETVTSYQPVVRLSMGVDHNGTAKSKTNNSWNKQTSKSKNVLHRPFKEHLNVNTTTARACLPGRAAGGSNQKTNGSNGKRQGNKRKTGILALKTGLDEVGLGSKQRIQCVKCNMDFSVRPSLLRHQLISCGSNNHVTKISDKEYLFDEFPITKTENGFHCDTCSMNKTLMKDMKYHIRIKHSNTASSMITEDQNNTNTEETQSSKEAADSQIKKKTAICTQISGKRKLKTEDRRTNFKGKLNKKKTHMNILKTYANLIGMQMNVQSTYNN